MRLLIVDDQQSAVQGLCDGIPWQDIGVTEVYTAQNAMEARLVFHSTPPHIMLCDIEMPVESGIELSRWVRDNHFETRIIFLSCHAKFEYAQDALRLGSIDYIVQPAPHGLVQETVQRVVDELRASEEQDAILTMGELYNRRKLTIRSSVLRNYLNSRSGNHTLDALSDTLSPALPVRLVLLQIVQQAPPEKSWDDDLLLTAIDNFAGEIFTEEQFSHITALVAENTFCLALQEKAPGGGRLAIESQAQYMHDVFRVYMPYKIACYIGGEAGLDAISTTWEALVRMRDENVALYSGVFVAGADVPQKAPATGEAPQSQGWKTFLKETDLVALEAIAQRALDEMVESNSMNAAALWSFYRDYMHVVLGKEEYERAEALFNGPEFIELYRNGMRSVEDMKKLIHYVAVHHETEAGAQKEDDHTQVVAKVIAYIQKNLDSNLRIETLAGQFYMSADHLTRIFKKETGQTVKAYITGQKMREAQSLLRGTQMPVSYIAARLGYTNYSHFSTAYKKEMGVSPQEERNIPGEE